MKGAFSSYHPAVNFLFFALVLVFSMWLMHPAALAVSLGAAFAWSVYLGGRKALRFNLVFILPMLVFTALLNPAFNHRGVTILAYLPSGNPLTLESILYGLAAAVMLMSVLLWFTCYNHIVTTDKFVYLFGRVIPALSLVLSMTLRFVPQFRAQLTVVANAQRCIGQDPSTGPLLQRARHAMRILSILITWSLEHAIETADSMKGRGYGLPGRTAFSIYSMDGRDRLALGWLGGLGALLLALCLAGGLEFRYFPALGAAPLTPWSVAALAGYALLCLTPLTLDLLEDRKWNYLRSTI